MKLPKAKQPAKGEGKRFLVLKNAVDDPLIQAKVKFLEFLSSKLNEFFLKRFQNRSTKGPFFSRDFGDILKGL